MTRLPSSSWHPIWQLNRGRRPRTRGVVIHVMAGTLPGTLTWWSRRGNTVGAHVCVSNTRVVQTADLDALCNHAAGENTHDGGLQWGNTEFVGIEHEGTGRETALGWLRRRKMLQMSAKRTAWILYHYKCGKPVWGENVVRHSAFSGTSHACPGAGFPRRIYMIWVRRAYRKLKNTNGRRWA